MNGTRNTKRKATPDDQGPAPKRPVNGAANGKPDEDHAEFAEVEYEYDDGSAMEDDVPAQGDVYASAPAAQGEWREAIQKVVRNVVAIRFCQTCAFDTEPALTSEATGFVVDAERGYVIYPGGVPGWLAVAVNLPVWLTDVP